MSAMGERFLILEETADALDVIDPQMALQFRVVNGLPTQAREVAPGLRAPEVIGSMCPAKRHEIRMDVGDHHIHCDCTCGAWHSAVDWDEIDTMVTQIRRHLGSVQATSDDGIAAASTSVSPADSEKRAG